MMTIQGRIIFGVVISMLLGLSALSVARSKHQAKFYAKVQRDTAWELADAKRRISEMEIHVDDLKKEIIDQERAFAIRENQTASRIVAADAPPPAEAK